MDGERDPTPESVFQRRARMVLATALVLAGLWILHAFLPALAWALVLCIALWPTYCRLLSLLPGRQIAAPLLLTVAVGLVFTAPLVLLGIAIAREMHVVVDLIAAARHNGIPVPVWVAGLPLGGPSLAEWWHNNLSDPVTADAMFGRLSHQIIAESAREYGIEIAHRVLILLFTLLTLFFLFRDGSTLAAQLRGLSDRVIGRRGEEIASHMIAAVHGTVNGLVLVGLAEGVVLGLCYLVAGLPYPAIIGAVTGVLAVIPFGAPVVYGLAALYLLATGNALGAVIVFVAGSVIVFVADHFVRPVLIGGSTRLPFLWVLLGLLGGLETLGFIGLFLGPAVLAALIALWREWTDDSIPAPQPRRAARDRVRRGARVVRRI